MLHFGYLDDASSPHLNLIDRKFNNTPLLFFQTEARFLAVVRHPNIIKMRAMDTGDPYTSTYFIVLDRLYDIMPTRIAAWKKRVRKGFGKMLFDRKGLKEQAFWVERLTVAYDISCALNYLHGNK